MSAAPRNVAASVRERLRKYAESGSGGYLLALQRYAMERLLYRLSVSPRRDAYVLKGAVLLRLWGESAARVTRDLDLLGSGAASPDEVASAFRGILESTVPPDGLQFPTERLRAAQILAGQEYVGVRLRLEALLEKARIPLQVDIGFGDAVFPRPLLAEFPSLLDAPRPRIRVYPKEAVVAEKLHAMVRHGDDNTRAKDFYDAYVLSSIFRFEGPTLAKSVQMTFRRRGTQLATEPPVALTEGFYEDETRRTRWRRYLQRDRLTGAPGDFVLVGARLVGFLWPILAGGPEQGSFTRIWNAGGPWR